MPPTEPSDFPAVPLDGVTELRIHGVSGTPVESMVLDPHPVQVWGDPVAGFYRRPADGNAGTDHLEAYSWGRLTAGASARAMWLLLLPFMLVNVASWAHPVRRGRRSAAVGTMSGALRVLAVTLTATFVLSVAILGMDLLAWQCAGAAEECGRLHWYTRWMTEGFWARPGARIAAGALVPLGFTLLIAKLSKSTTTRYERYAAEAPEAHEADPNAPLGGLDMANPRFWKGLGPVTRLRAMHLATALSLVAGLVAYAARYEDDAPSNVIGTLVAVAAALLVAAIAVVLFTPFAGRRRDLLETRPPTDNFCKAILWTPYVAGLLLVLAIAYALFFTDRAHAAGSLPGGRGLKHVLFWAQAAGLLTVFVANVVARARDRDLRSSVRGPLMGGLLASFLAFLAVGLAGVFAAGLTVRVADYLGCLDDCGPGSARIVVPTEYVLTARSFLAVLVLTLLVGVPYFVVMRRRARALAARNVADEYRDVIAGRTDAETNARRADIAVVQGDAALTDVPLWPVALIVCGGALLGSISLIGRVRAEDATAYATTLATWLVGAFALALVGLGRTAYRNAGMRRTVGILWDLGTFWPRACHPFAPPCYCERTMPETVRRIEQIHANGGAVVVSAHSQGTVIAFAALLQLGRHADELALLTYGSPLHRLYARAFPHFFGLPVLEWGRARLGNRWINLYRRSDPIGGPVTAADDQVPADAVRPDRRLHDPAFAMPPYAFVYPVARGHSNYFHDPAFPASVATLANEVRGR